MSKFGKEAFANENYQLATDIFLRCLQERGQQQILSTSDLYFEYGDSLARSGRLYEAFNVYSVLVKHFDNIIPIERFQHLTIGLLDSIENNLKKNVIKTKTDMAAITSSQRILFNHEFLLINNNNNNNNLDLFLCPICDDVLYCPVTINCGHTFCRLCYINAKKCNLCNNGNIPNQNGINDSSEYINNIKNIKPDILVRRLVDKWWPQQLKSREINDTASRYLDINSLDISLKYCNESIQICPNNYKTLLLRSEVLYRLNHYQSSLADADNALKINPTSAKAYQRRALALAELGRYEDALISQCLAANLDSKFCSDSSQFQNEICRLLQRFFIGTFRCRNYTSATGSKPYSMGIPRHRHRKRLMQVSQSTGNSDCDEENSSCGEDDYFVHNTRRYSIRMANLAADCIIPKMNTRTRTLLERIQKEILRIQRLPDKSQNLQIHPINVDVTDFDCVLCCRSLWKPVVTPCGHTYCLVCLDRCMDYSSSCPLCMSPLIEENRPIQNGLVMIPSQFSITRKSTTKFIENAMQKFIPEWYEKRRRQEIDLEPSVPVFICTTAFPNVPCPLFVYEPRYRLMVRRAIASGERQFGIVQPNASKSRYSDIGTILDIRDCVLLADGCSILSTIGCRRFRILSRNEKDGYETAKVDYIHDEPIPQDYVSIVSDMHFSVLKKAKKWYESLANDIKEEILRSFGPMPILEDKWETIADGPSWTWWIIAILPLNQQLKVNILGTTSLEKRLRAIGKTLDYLNAKHRRSQQSCLVVACDSVLPCQAIDCCQRNDSSSNTAEERTTNNEPTEYML